MMKKLLIAMMCIASVFITAACRNSTASTSEPTSASLDVGNRSWNTEEYMIPFWKTDKIVDESILLVSNGNEAAEGELLFAPDKIESVVSYNPYEEKTVVYTEGEDYVVEGKKIKAVSKKMPFMTEDQLSGKDKMSGFDYSQIPSTDKGLYLPFTESTGFIEKQIFVTYIHTQKWNKETPAYAGDKLSNLAKKIAKKEKINLFVYGDSISTGANSSGYLNVYPNKPSWPQAIRKGLADQFGTEVELVNKAVGGWTSENAVKSQESIGWVNGKQISQAGIKVTLEEMPDYKPDLAVIGFGMNDATMGISKTVYRAYMQKIIKTIKDRNSDCEFILLGTMLANPKAYNQSKNQISYYDELLKIAEGDDKITSVNIGKMHEDLLDSGKKYADMTSNNVNHPNDFMASVYAMNILSLLIK